MTREELIKQAEAHAAAKRPIAAESADKRVRVEVILDSTTGQFIQATITGHAPGSP